MRSGFVAIIGRPNVGKSTFLNTVIGKKIAIMSNKPQTTRNTISGVLTEADSQIIFIDTPGIHKPHNELGARMTKSAYQSTRGVDAILWMISAKEHFTLGEEMILDNIKNTNTPVFLCINKIDLLKNRNEIDKIILEYNDKFNFKGIYPISALENQNIVHVLNDIKEVLPEGPQYYPADMITDHPERFLIAEIIREKVLHNTEEEIPHSVAVVIDMLKKNEDNPNIIDCYASIYVERKSQKGIIIGAGGGMLKKISSQARKDIINILGSKVYLEVWVKVKEDWRNRENALKSFGYGDDNF